MESSLQSISNDLASLVSRVSPSVVVVHGRRHNPSSGVLWRKDLIVTAEHTIRRDEEITVGLAEGQPVGATLLGRDPGTDLALLKTEGIAATPIDVGDRYEPRAGDITLVIGRSPNSGPNVSMGVISAVSGPWQTWRGGKLDSYIRLDATVFPGTSGGAVVDVRGRLVGIATSALSRIAGLAIPASTVDKTIDVLLEKGGIPRGYVGVSLQAVPMPEAFREKFSLKNEQGMMVLNVEPGSAGDRSGILIGDLVFEIEGKPVESIEDLQSFLGWESIGKTLRVRTIRGGAVTDLNIRVGERGTRGAQ